MADQFDLNPNRLLLTDDTTGAVLGLYINNGKAIIVDGGLNTLHNINNFSSGTAAARPAAGTLNNWYYATDSAVLSFDNGTAWEDQGKPYSNAIKVYRSGTVQSIPDNAWTKVQFNAEVYDDHNEFDSSVNYRFTCVTDANYHITAACRMAFGMAADCDLQLAIYKNGSLQAYGGNWRVDGAINPCCAVAADVALVATDYIELFIYHLNGAAHDLEYLVTKTWMGIHVISV